MYSITPKLEPVKCSRCGGVTLPKGVSLSGNDSYCLCPPEASMETTCPHCGGKIYARVKLTAPQASGAKTLPSA